MSVVSVTRRWSGRQGGEETRNASTSNQDATIVFDVLTDNTDDDEAVALIGPGIPIPLQAHPSRPWLRCSRRRANQLEPNRWEVTAEYESVQGGQGNNSPLDAPPKIRWATLHRDEEIDEDYEGKPICTILGEPIEPRMRTNKPDLLLVVTRNLPDFNPGVIIPYMMDGGAVSSDEFLNQPAGTARIHDLEANSQEATDFVYWTATAQIRFRRGVPSRNVTDEQAFYRRVLAQGFFVRKPLLFTNPVQYIITRALDGGGQPASKPVPHYVRETTITETINGVPTQVAKKPGEQIKADINDPWPFAQFYMFRDFQTLPFNSLGIL